MRTDYKGMILRIKKEVKHPQVPDFGGSEVWVEGYWDDIAGKSWMDCNGNPACLVFAMRTGFGDISIPNDNDVLYVKRKGMGHLVHLKELDV